jgi:hypothetical protein
MSGEESKRRSNWPRWVARAMGTPIAAFWLFVGIVSGVVDEAPWNWESAVLGALILASAVSVAAAWRWERAGGIAVVACGLAHSAFALIAAGHSKGFAVLISGVPFLLVGGLFLWSWWRSRESDGRPAEAKWEGGRNDQGDCDQR